MSTETFIEAGNLKPRIQFTADGSQKEFQFFFKVYEPENVKVYIEDVEQDSGYNLSIHDDIQGGIVTFDQPPESGKLVTIYRELELKRTTNFKEGGPFRSSNVNAEFDYQLSCLEQLEDSIGRTVTFPQYAPTNLNINLPMPDAGKSIIWSNNEDCLVNSDFQFDNVVNLSSQYCSQTKEYLNQVQDFHSLVATNLENVQNLKNDVIELKDITLENTQKAENFALDAAVNSVNSLYNQAENLNHFDINLKEGTTIYITPLIQENTDISFNFDELLNLANIITFELYLHFEDFYAITFSNINISWLNGREPRLDQDETLTKILTFRNKNIGNFDEWIVSLEGGF